LDFGLAKGLSENTLTQKGMTFGTVTYMSPEQARGEKVDQRTDIWSLGVVLYEMLTGELPFKGDYEQAIIYSILNEDFAPVTKFDKNIPEELENILNKCLCKDAKDRYPSVSELLTELIYLVRGLESEGIFLHRSRPTKLSRILHRNTVLLAAVLLGVLLLIFFLIEQKTVMQWFGFESIPAKKYLAVLPFVAVGGDSSDIAFCDGLVETLTSKLSQIEQFQKSLYVVPSSEIRKDAIVGADEARKRFGVNLVLTGSSQRFDNRVRVTMNLVDPKSIRQLKSVVVTDPMTSLSSFQDGLVLRLVQMLNVELQPETRSMLTAGGTKVPSAYDFYLQGLGYLQRYEKLKNINTAIGLFKVALEEDSSYALAYAGLGEAYWRKYKINKDVQWVTYAINFCDLALQYDKQIPFVYITLGLIQTGTGHYEEAIENFQKALQLDPVNSSAYREMAKTYEAMGKLKQAETTYKKAIQFRPNDWATYNNMGVFYYCRGQYQEALRQFERVVALTPDNSRGFNNLGGIYFILNLREKAKQMFKKSLEIVPNYRAYSNLGTLYFYESHYDKAARMCKKALELSDHDYRVWGALAESYYWTSEKLRAYPIYQKAITLAEKQLEINPHDLLLLADLANYFTMIGKHSKPLSILKQIENLKVQNLEVMFIVADTYEKLGKRKIALKWIKKAIKKGFPMTKINDYPGLKQLRTDVQFQQILKGNNKQIPK